MRIENLITGKRLIEVCHAFIHLFRQKCAFSRYFSAHANEFVASFQGCHIANIFHSIDMNSFDFMREWPVWKITKRLNARISQTIRKSVQ